MSEPIVCCSYAVLCVILCHNQPCNNGIHCRKLTGFIKSGTPVTIDVYEHLWRIHPESSDPWFGLSACVHPLTLPHHCPKYFMWFDSLTNADRNMNPVDYVLAIPVFLLCYLWDFQFSTVSWLQDSWELPILWRYVWIILSHETISEIFNTLRNWKSFDPHQFVSVIRCFLDTWYISVVSCMVQHKDLIPMVSFIHYMY